MADHRRLSRSTSSSSVVSSPSSSAVSSRSSSPEPSPRKGPATTAGVHDSTNNSTGVPAPQHGPLLGSPGRVHEKAQEARASLDEERGVSSSSSGSRSRAEADPSAPVLVATGGGLSPWKQKLQALLKNTALRNLVVVPSLISTLPDLSTATDSELHDAMYELRARGEGLLVQLHEEVEALTNFAGKVSDPWLKVLACFLSAVHGSGERDTQNLARMKKLVGDIPSSPTSIDPSVPLGWVRPDEWGPEMNVVADYLEQNGEGRFFWLRTLFNELPDLLDASAEKLEEKAKAFRSIESKVHAYSRASEPLTELDYKFKNHCVNAFFHFMRAVICPADRFESAIAVLRQTLQRTTDAPVLTSSSGKSQSDKVSAAKPTGADPAGLKQADLLANLRKHRDRYKKEFGKDVVLFATMVAEALPAQSSLDNSYPTGALKKAMTAAKAKMRDHLRTTPVKIEKKKVLLSEQQVEERMQAIAKSADKAVRKFLAYSSRYKTTHVIRLIGSISEFFDDC